MTTLSELNGNYVVDPTHTAISFVTRHAMVTKVRGHFDAEGTAHFDGANPKNSSVRVTLDVNSVNTGNADRDNHLRTSDFFEPEKYPTITFVSTDVNPTSDDEVEITGDLTIRDVTKQITFPVELTGRVVDPFGNDRVGFEGKTTVNRSDFGLTWNAALETGGVLVSDKVTLEFDVALVAQNDEAQA